MLPITIKNTGDAPLAITGVALANSTNATSQQLVREGERPGDFQVLDNAGCLAAHLAPGASCFVNVGFKPTSTSTRSVARLIVLSNADNATESILLTGQSTARHGRRRRRRRVRSQPDAGRRRAASASFVPAVARTYDAATAASVVEHRRQRDAVGHRPERAATGHLVNGTFSLSQPLQIRATNAANTTSAFAPLSRPPARRRPCSPTTARPPVPTASPSASVRRSSPTTSCARAPTRRR